jgi:hypothetical protein
MAKPLLKSIFQLKEWQSHSSNQSSSLKNGEATPQINLPAQRMAKPLLKSIFQLKEWRSHSLKPNGASHLAHSLT